MQSESLSYLCIADKNRINLKGFHQKYYFSIVERRFSTVLSEVRSATANFLIKASGILVAYTIDIQIFISYFLQEHLNNLGKINIANNVGLKGYFKLF